MIGKEKLAVITLHVQAEIKKRIKQDAALLERSEGWIVRKIFAHYYRGEERYGGRNEGEE